MTAARTRLLVATRLPDATSIFNASVRRISYRLLDAVRFYKSTRTHIGKRVDFW